MHPRWSLAGQTAVVTGGTKGIGRACVEVKNEFSYELNSYFSSLTLCPQRLGAE